ncbi:MAG TPA: serpin family protein [Kofleriaceae bacterium]|nr:serpin family protein [Kofleriaceae bacterium]
MDQTALVKGHNNFAVELYRQLPPGNVAMSPASVTIALTMTWTGAKGATAADMAKVLHFTGDQIDVLSKWGQLSQGLVDPKRPFTLHLANRLFADKHRELDTVFFDINMKTFGARTDAMDFRDDPEGTREKINIWVGQATEDKIKDLLPPRSLNSATRLVIVNAIYFLADWADTFSKSATRKEDFHVAATSTKSVDMMHRLGSYKYVHDGDASLLELPYKGDAVSMYVLLPDAIDGLPAIEAKLADTLRSLQTKLAETQVAVGLPRFTIDMPAPIDLVPALQALGMKLPFEPAADFSGISKDPHDPLFISSVLHKAMVKVDEKGTEAAAATAVMMPRGAPPRPAATFTADHPFVFLIVDRASGLILFIGRVAAP